MGLNLEEVFLCFPVFVNILCSQSCRGYTRPGIVSGNHSDAPQMRVPANSSVESGVVGQPNAAESDRRFWSPGVGAKRRRHAHPNGSGQHRDKTFRMESRLSSMRYALWTKPIQYGVGEGLSEMTSCQLPTGSWLATNVDDYHCFAVTVRTENPGLA